MPSTSIEMLLRHSYYIIINEIAKKIKTDNGNNDDDQLRYL